MAALLGEGFLRFAQLTGILDDIRRYQDFVPWCLLAVGLFTCFFGFRSFRVLFGGLVFMTVTSVIVRMLRVSIVLDVFPEPWVIVILMLILMLVGLVVHHCGYGGFKLFIGAFVFLWLLLAFVVMLREKPDWGSVTTCFAIVATTLAFLAYFWVRLGACAVCGLISAALGWAAFRSPWAAIPAAMLGVALALSFPVIELSAATSLFGAWVLRDTAALFGVAPAVAPAAGLLGFGLQLLMGRRQMVFKKTMPDRVTHYLEERKRRHAHGIP